MKKIFWLFVMLLSVMLFNNKVLAYKEYKIGDKVTYNNEDYYVIEDSDSNVDYVTILKLDPLTADEVNRYSNIQYESKNGEFPYYTSDSCYFNSNTDYNVAGCTANYKQSSIKTVVDNWADDQFDKNDLVTVNGYKVKLLTSDYLRNNFFYELDDFYCGKAIYKTSSDTPEWIYINGNSYWTMTSDDYSTMVLASNYTNFYETYNQALIRPVIHLHKCSLNDSDSSCKTIIKYKDYNVGDEVEYKGEKYYVIESSNVYMNYVTLLKVDPLTEDQINSYSDIEYDSNTMILSSYYTSTDCSDRLDYGAVNNSCLIDYTSSNVKLFVDKWVNANFNDNDLVEVNGYKTRLITIDEYKEINESWLKDYSYWFMDGIVGTGIVSDWTEIEFFKLVRPVINLSKDKIGDQEEYKIGDVVTYNGDNYYVIEDNDKSKNYVVLLKEIPLKFRDINSGKIGNFPYYKSDTCNSDDQTGCIINYDESSIKILVDNWSNNELDNNDLVEVGGYKVRLIMLDELRENLGYEPSVVISTTYFRLTEDVPNWLYTTDYSYWTMSEYISDKEQSIYVVYNNGFLYTEDTYVNSAVRPVINLDKCAIDGGCWEEGTLAEDNNVLNNEESKTVVTVENTLKVISNIVFIISIILIIGGLGILGYNYIKSKKELKK